MKKKLTTFCADGDGAMQGHRVGLVGRLRRHCDCVIGMHCAAHKHVLAISDSASSMQLLKDVDSMLVAVHSLFLRNSKYVFVWGLFAKRHGLTAFTFPIFVPTRWFSRSACVFRILNNYPVLVRFLQTVTQGTSHMYWKKAEPVLDMFTNARNVVLLHAVGDILIPLESSRKLFESRGCTLSSLTAELNVLTERLATLQENTLDWKTFSGKYMNSLLNASNDLSPQGDSMMLRWSKHTWSVRLHSASLLEGLLPELESVVAAIGANISDRFRAEERGFAHLFDIFQLETFFFSWQHLGHIRRLMNLIRDY